MCNIGRTPIVFVTIVMPVEVVVVVVVSISNILTLSVVITIVLTFISMTLAPILLIRALGVWSEIPCMVIYSIRVLPIVIFISRQWWFR